MCCACCAAHATYAVPAALCLLRCAGQVPDVDAVVVLGDHVCQKRTEDGKAAPLFGFNGNRFHTDIPFPGGRGRWVTRVGFGQGWATRGG